MLYPQDSLSDAVAVNATDLAWLDPMSYLNDTCVDFYIKCDSITYP